MQSRKVTTGGPRLFVPTGCPDIIPGMTSQSKLLQTEMYHYSAIASGTTRLG